MPINEHKMKRAKTSKGKTGQKSVTSKPFCDCTQHCNCKTCLDLKEEFGLRDIDDVKVRAKSTPKAKKKTIGGVKISTPTKTSKDIVGERKRPSLLDVLRNDQQCNCETVARAVSTDVHRNLNIHDNQARPSKDVEHKTMTIL